MGVRVYMWGAREKRGGWRSKGVRGEKDRWKKEIVRQMDPVSDRGKEAVKTSIVSVSVCVCVCVCLGVCVCLCV